jgi:hypothetical protein
LWRKPRWELGSRKKGRSERRRRGGELRIARDFWRGTLSERMKFRG